MQKTVFAGLVFTLFAVPGAFAQYPDAGGPQGPPMNSQVPDRQYPGGRAERPHSFETEPAPGISVRSELHDGVMTGSSSGGATEVHVVHGRADVIVRHPEGDSEILVDLPGGQVSLIKDGFYTFNADTNTVRVLNGEAVAYNGAADMSKGTKVKETQQLSFSAGAKLKANDADRRELTADLLPGNEQDERGRGQGHAEGPYGDGFVGGGYPYGGGFGYGYAPYGFYPYGYGYPFGLGLGFGYYGGFGGYGRFGGFRGGGFRR